MASILDHAVLFVRIHDDTLIAAVLIAVAGVLIRRDLYRRWRKSKQDRIRRNEQRLRNFGA
ncbi:MAG TPA: hypothetical protein VMX97_13075 [Hyphomicrobiaceae bacterium]|nr:hypothetical protein [Hyphomicrobiaceae bacterium]